MKNFVIGLLILGLTNLTIAQSNQFAQNVHLAEVTIVPRNLTYISNVLDDNTPRQIKNLETSVARYDVTAHPNFNDRDIDAFEVVFEQPNARIIATYDKNGQILKSFEKFQDVILPKDLVKEIMMEYPGWEFHSDTYLVSYYTGRDVKKHYKIQLMKDKNRVNLKVDPSGNII